MITSPELSPILNLQGDRVAALDVVCQRLHVGLDVEGRAACPHGVVLECDGCAEHRHDAVAGELVDRAAVALHDRRRATEHLAHDLAQPLRPDGSGDVHRADHVGEQNGNLLVLGTTVGGGDR